MKRTSRESKKYSRIPFLFIKFYVDQLHVWTPLNEIKQEISARCVRASLSPKEIKEAQAYALEMHQKNYDT